VTTLTVPHMRTGRVQPGLDPTSLTGKGMVATVACGLTLRAAATTGDPTKVGAPLARPPTTGSRMRPPKQRGGTTGVAMYCTCGHRASGLKAARTHRAHIEEMNAA
jgi:hypothetical protein